MNLQLLVALGTLGIAAQAADQAISLAGEWRFQLDRADVGMSEAWSVRTLSDSIKLPGGLTEQGVGDPLSVETKWIGSIVDKSWFTAPEFARYRERGNVKVPFWLQPELYYAGAAWFQREVEIPRDWEGKRVVLFLERAHWETRVWVDGQSFGTSTALGTPHEHDLGQLAPGKHTLTIRVHNRMIVDVGENSHSISDHTQGNWNGIVGKIELRATPSVWIEDLQVYPDAAKKSVRVLVTATNTSGRRFVGKLMLSFASKGKISRLPVSRNFNTTAVNLTTEDNIELEPDAPVWDEFSPNLHSIHAELRGELDGQPVQSERTVNYGLREISTDGTQFTINGRKLFFRGTLECCIFPRTGHPPTDVASWKRIIRIAKAHGLNMLRFHSWCPPEAAFIAADELGFYLHVECSSWANQSTTLGDGQPVDRWIYEEADRILKAYGNHPSFVLFLYGNEPGGAHAGKFLAEWVEHYKARDPRHLITSSAGWPQLPENQFHISPDPRIQRWGDALKSRINAKPPETMTDYRKYIRERSVPVISHEIGQWCVYPNFKEMKNYTGYLKPRNFEIFRDHLEANGLARLAKQFLLASGKLQVLCYKEDIESALRTPGMGGFQLLDLHDFPGQGTALVGVLDPFWEEKGYITDREYNRFCNAVVPLARMNKRVFTTDETFSARVELANFGAAPLEKAVVEWKLVGGDGKTWAAGELSPQSVPVDNGIALGEVLTPLGQVAAPAQGKFIVHLKHTSFENDWSIWVYSPGIPADAPADVFVTSQFDDSAQARLRAGGKVLLTIPGTQVRNFDTAPVKLGFSSIFWNTAWTRRQAPTTLGILCDPRHPAFAQFPTDYHSNWQWWYLIHRASALRLDLLPHDTQPVVRVIDDWVTAHPLGLIIEGKVGAGKIIICGFDLTRDADDSVSRQMRASLAHYLDSKDCKPAAKFTFEEIQGLIVQGK